MKYKCPECNGEREVFEKKVMVICSNCIIEMVEVKE